MNKDFSASKSQKIGTATAGTTPFDAIVALEEQEKKRVQIELDAMQEAENAARQTCEKKELEAEQELKAAAKADLKEYKTKELSPILKKGEKDAANRCKKIDEIYNARAEEMAQGLANTLADSDSLLAA